MKPHRQIRHSRRVSSETGVAITAEPALWGQPQYDWEPPRVATDIKNRAARLKALGNAVNPLQIYPIMYAIKLINDWLREGRA